MSVRKEFIFTTEPTDLVVEKADRIIEIFSDALNQLEEICGPTGREMALVKTKLQEAHYFATRAMALNEEQNGG